MAQFTREELKAKQQEKIQKKDSTKRVDVDFIGNYLKDDGSTAIVRFPYKSLDDVMYETVHMVDYPGAKWQKSVRCLDENCPLCAEGNKIKTRAYIKALVYEGSGNNVTIHPAIWDRPQAFADSELKTAMDEYGDEGDITHILFKIKRTGEGQQTRYNLIPIIGKDHIYPESVYKLDFDLFGDLNPAIILSKSYEQYQAALAGSAAPAVEQQAPAQVEVTPTPAPVVQNVQVKEPVVETATPVRHKYSI